MARITPEELWKLVVKTGLCGQSAVDLSRAEHRATPAASTADAKAVAAWLVERGVITRWQAKRLSTGDEGPFFQGDYRLLERHDHDGEAFEFTARHEPSGRIVCVVLMSKKHWRDPPIRDAIVRRMTTATQAADPLLVRTWALEEADGRPLAVCEEVRGETLADELVRRGPLPLREAGEIALEVARAVAELHAAGETHGGLSLDAIVREPPDAGGRLRLRQFPLATDPHLVPSRVRMASEADLVILGRRAAFVAPELVTGGSCDQRSDVYAIGCILHALVTGRAPGWNGDARETLDRAAAGGPGPLDPAVAPAPLATLVDYMTARDPRDRYPDAAETARAIATCFGFPQPTPAGPAVPAFAPAAPSPAGAAGRAPRPLDPETLRAAATETARRRGRRLRWIGGTVAGAILALTAAIVVIRTMPTRRPSVAVRKAPPRAVAPPRDVAALSPDEQREPAAAERREPAAAEPAAPPPPTSDPAPAGQTLVDDDTLPWGFPPDRTPLALAYLPQGSQLVVAARPAKLLGDEEGRLFARALGPRVEAALAAVAAACGCRPEEIDTLQAGWQAEGTDALVAGWTARLVDGKTLPDDQAFRTRAWGAAAAAGSETIHGTKPWSYWAPSREGGRVLVAAPAERLAAIVEASGTAPPPLVLPADLERLVATLDGSRHVTVLGSPYYLLNSGRAILTGQLEPLAAGIESLLGEDVQAAALSAHCGEDFYVELAAIATLDLPAAALATRLAERIAGYPAAVEAFCAARQLHPYGRALVMRLPTAVRMLAANVRAGPEDKLAVANAYLPRHAGHNLALAAELALAQAAGGAPPAAAPAAVVTAPQGALDRLGQRMTLVFAKDTLEKSIQMISEEIGVPMEILGPDLQLDGITQNQSFALEERDKPAADILRVILAKSNPDGKLVYVVRKQGGVESIVITTRAAVAKRGDVLPPAFQEAGGAARRDSK